MKKDKWYAAGWAAVGLLYQLIAAYNFHVGQMLFAVPTMLIGWGMCTGGCFYYGARYGVNSAFDEVIDLLDQAKEITKQVQQVADQLGGGGEDEKAGTL